MFWRRSNRTRGEKGEEGDNVNRTTKCGPEFNVTDEIFREKFFFLGFLLFWNLKKKCIKKSHVHL